jgi:hypothetical protein
MMPHVDDIRTHFPVSVHTVYAPSGHFSQTIFNISPAAKKLAAGEDVELTPANLQELFLFDGWNHHVKVAEGNCVKQRFVYYVQGQCSSHLQPYTRLLER